MRALINDILSSPAVKWIGIGIMILAGLVLNSITWEVSRNHGWRRSLGDYSEFRDMWRERRKESKRINRDLKRYQRHKKHIEKQKRKDGKV